MGRVRIDLDTMGCRGYVISEVAMINKGLKSLTVADLKVLFAHIVDGDCVVVLKGEKLDICFSKALGNMLTTVTHDFKDLGYIIRSISVL